MVINLFKKIFKKSIDLEYLDSDYIYGSTKRFYCSYLKEVAESIKLISNTSILKRYVYNQPSIIFLILNKFYQDFLDNKYSSDSKNVYLFTNLSDYIDNNSFTVDKYL